MKVFQINICPDLSTGKVMMGIADAVRDDGGSCLTASAPKNNKNVSSHWVIGTKFERNIHLVLGKIVGCEYAFSHFATLQLIRKIKQYNPDIVHLHNLHAYYLNLNMLMRYLIQSKRRIVWTFHDCWPFTGQCPHFTIAHCDKWIEGCSTCTQIKLYPYCKRDVTALKFKQKKEWFTNFSSLLIVTPSNWLASLVAKSFLKEKKIAVVRNGIDLSIFTPTISQFRKSYNCINKNVLLGVASGWSRQKGLDVFIELVHLLGLDYQIILVGTDDSIDALLPKEIISIHRTYNQKELAEIYTSADLFVNPTREDNYPTVNMEALACGTPVLTFKTGGSPEIIDETCGSVVEYDAVKELVSEIKRICSEKPYSSESCLKRARSFDMNERFKEYIDLYKRSE